MAYQNLFNTITNLSEWIPLETDMQEIIRAIQKDLTEAKDPMDVLAEVCVIDKRELQRGYEVEMVRPSEAVEAMEKYNLLF